MMSDPPPPKRRRSASGSAPHRSAFLATLGFLVVVGGAFLGAGVVGAATRKITLRAVVTDNSADRRITADVTLTSPVTAVLHGSRAIRVTGSTRYYKHRGSTSVDGAQGTVTRNRVQKRNVDEEDEIIVVGTYDTGTNVVTASRVHILDGRFHVCGEDFREIDRTQQRLRLLLTRRSVQETRYQTLLPLKTEVWFNYTGSTDFFNANGSWKNPKNRVSIGASDVTASDQTARFSGTVRDGSRLEVETVYLDVSC